MTGTSDLIESILSYFQTHRRGLDEARKAIEKGNSSLAHEILNVTIRNIDVYIHKLEEIV